MRDARLNLLLTTPPNPAYERGGGSAGGQPWHRTVSQLLVPLGVRTFEARSGSEAVALMERHPIHLAVMDTRLPAIGGLNVLQLIQRLHAQGQWHTAKEPNDGTPKSDATTPTTPGIRDAEDGSGAAIEFRMQVEERSPDGQTTQRRIEVRIDARIQQQSGPVVILIAPPPPHQDKQLLQEALKFNAFSVLSEPVDVNVALEVMARAMKRCFSGQWPC